MRAAPGVAHEAAAMVDAWGEGAPRRALGCQRRARLAMVAPAFARERSVGGSVLSLAGGEGCTVSGARAGLAGQAHADVGLAPRLDAGALVACKTAGHRVSREALAQGTPHPRIAGCWRGDTDTALAGRSARRVQAAVVCGLSPVEADARRTGIHRETGHGSPPAG